MCCGIARASRGTSTAWCNIIVKPGTYLNSNIIDSGGAKAEFVNFSPSTLTYTVLLKAGAQAIGAATVGTATDIVGYTRVAPYTAGAYSYPF